MQAKCCWLSSLAIAATLFTGCFGPEEPVVVVTDERVPANLESVETVEALGHLAAGAVPVNMAARYLYRAEWPQDGCPSATWEGDTLVFTGGCIDESGRTWSGRFEAQADGQGFGWILFQDWRLDVVEECGGEEVDTTEVLNGFASRSRLYGGLETYTVDMRHTLVGFGEDDRVEGYLPEDRVNCDPTLFELEVFYVGTSRSVWNVNLEGQTVMDGTGEIWFSPVGAADVVTDTYFLDRTVCETEAVSGTSTFLSDGHVTVLEYDGATDCDPDSTVLWTYDDTSMGELRGFGCSMSGIAAGSPGGLSVFGLAGVLVVIARRRRRRQC